ncbi:MAG: PEP-CTERM sorting domain-containing protein [Planctomycetota bacterium]
MLQHARPIALGALTAFPVFGRAQTATNPEPTDQITANWTGDDSWRDPDDYFDFMNWDLFAVPDNTRYPGYTFAAVMDGYARLDRDLTLDSLTLAGFNSGVEFVADAQVKIGVIQGQGVLKAVALDEAQPVAVTLDLRHGTPQQPAIVSNPYQGLHFEAKGVGASLYMLGSVPQTLHAPQSRNASGLGAWDGGLLRVTDIDLSGPWNFGAGAGSRVEIERATLDGVSLQYGDGEYVLTDVVLRSAEVSVPNITMQRGLIENISFRPYPYTPALRIAASPDGGFTELRGEIPSITFVGDPNSDLDEKLAVTAGHTATFTYSGGEYDIVLVEEDDSALAVTGGTTPDAPAPATLINEATIRGAGLIDLRPEPGALTNAGPLSILYNNAAITADVQGQALTILGAPGASLLTPDPDYGFQSDLIAKNGATLAVRDVDLGQRQYIVVEDASNAVFTNTSFAGDSITWGDARATYINTHMEGVSFTGVGHEVFGGSIGDLSETYNYYTEPDEIRIGADPQGGHTSFYGNHDFTGNITFVADPSSDQDEILYVGPGQLSESFADRDQAVILLVEPNDSVLRVHGSDGAEGLKHAELRHFTVRGAGRIDLSADLDGPADYERVSTLSYAQLVADRPGLPLLVHGSGGVSTIEETDFRVEHGAILHLRDVDVAFSRTTHILDGALILENTPFEFGHDVLINGLLELRGDSQFWGYGAIAGQGIIRADLLDLQDATLSPGDGIGMLTVEGDATLSYSSRLKIEAAGLAHGQDHDRLAVTGALDTAWADIELTLIDGFVPAVGDTLEIAHANAGLTNTYRTLRVTASEGVIVEVEPIWTEHTLALRVLSVTGDQPADTNGDQTIDLLDFDNLAAAFGRPSTRRNLDGDFNADGVVDLLDFDILAQNFGASSPATLPGAAAIPEPASLAILALVGAGGLRRRR